MIRPQILTSLVLSFFVFISLFGVNAAMNHEENGQMGRCPFMGEVTAICSMNAVEHLSAWIQSFITIPTKSYAVVLSGLLFIYFFSAKGGSASGGKEKFAQPFLTKSVILERQQYPKIFNHLRTFFSKGILHSRIYA